MSDLKTSVLFYISGHGYGHAVRMGAVMRELGQMQPGWRILVRTQAPRFLFPDDVEFTSAGFDSGVVEQDAGLVVDEQATVEKLKRLLTRWDDVVESEAGFINENSVDLIVADVPPIAGDIARATGVGCIAISNFTWDWIYEPYAREHIGRLESAYSHMRALVQLPFGQRERLRSFPRVVDAPLISRATKKPLSPQSGGRIRVLLGSRAPVSDLALARASAEGTEFEFVVPPIGSDFPDALASCDLVLAKLGFGIVADCIAAGKPLLYPPRANFREENILQAEAPRHIPALPIPVPDFYAGAWASSLRELVSKTPVPSNLETNGANFCAAFLINELLSA